MIQTNSTDLLRRFELSENPYEHLQHLKWNDKLAVAVSLQKMKSEKLMLKFDVYCFKEPNQIYGYPLKILAKKDFPFLSKLNNFISMASESGLISKWLEGCGSQSMFEKKPLYEYMEVKFEMLMSFVAILVSLQVFALLIGVLERAAYKKVYVEKNNSFWRYVEIWISPDRCFSVAENEFLITVKAERLKNLPKPCTSTPRRFRFE